jgi:hypothetical protein
MTGKKSFLFIDLQKHKENYFKETLKSGMNILKHNIKTNLKYNIL